MCKDTDKEGGVDLDRTPGKVFRMHSLQPRLQSFRWKLEFQSGGVIVLHGQIINIFSTAIHNY